MPDRCPATREAVEETNDNCPLCGSDAEHHEIDKGAPTCSLDFDDDEVIDAD